MRVILPDLSPLLSLAHMETPAIQTHGLTRHFGALTAVEDVTLTVASGQFFGFLGPNGAGKSTTIKMLTGLLEPTAGTIEILGKPFTADALDLKRQIGVVPEGMALLGRLTAPEYLRFVGRMYGLERDTVNHRTEELLEFMRANHPEILEAIRSTGALPEESELKTALQAFKDTFVAMEGG